MWNKLALGNGAVVAVLGALLVAPSQGALARTAGGPIVREQRNVRVGDIAETWQLVWRGKPAPVCPPDDMEGSITEPCRGLAFGEYGDLWLVRKRQGREVERMDLKPIFGRFDYPDADTMRGKAWLQRRAMKLSDIGRSGRAFVAEVGRRPITTIMKFADYDRDGHATEFLIQVGTMAGAVQIFAAVGVSARNPHLHALSSVEKPDAALEMQYRPWRILLTATRPTRVTTWECDDHGSSIQQDFIVSARQGSIHSREVKRHCPVEAQR